MEKDEILNKAIHKREITSRNLGFRQEYEVYCWMKKIAMVQAEQKGIVRGLQQGLEQGRIEMIQRMHDGGMTVHEIAQIVKMKVEKIQRILDVS